MANEEEEHRVGHPEVPGSKGVRIQHHLKGLQLQIPASQLIPTTMFTRLRLRPRLLHVPAEPMDNFNHLHLQVLGVVVVAVTTQIRHVLRKICLVARIMTGILDLSRDPLVRILLLLKAYSHYNLHLMPIHQFHGLVLLLISLGPLLPYRSQI